MPMTIQTIWVGIAIKFRGINTRLVWVQNSNHRYGYSYLILLASFTLFLLVLKAKRMILSIV